MLSKFLIASFLIAYPGYFTPWGKDSDLQVPAPPAPIENVSFATRLVDVVIKFHQEVISPVDGPRSHYRPSSSQYMQQAIHNYGFLKGFIMGCDRLIRENDEEWVYRQTLYEGKLYKYDPAKENKYE